MKIDIKQEVFKCLTHYHHWQNNLTVEEVKLGTNKYIQQMIGWLIKIQDKPERYFYKGRKYQDLDKFKENNFKNMKKRFLFYIWYML